MVFALSHSYLTLSYFVEIHLMLPRVDDPLEVARVHRLSLIERIKTLYGILNGMLSTLIVRARGWNPLPWTSPTPGLNKTPLSDITWPQPSRLSRVTSVCAMLLDIRSKDSVGVHGWWCLLFRALTLLARISRRLILWVTEMMRPLEVAELHRLSIIEHIKLRSES